jgi:hypothetical protein
MTDLVIIGVAVVAAAVLERLVGASAVVLIVFGAFALIQKSQAARTNKTSAS